MMRKSRRLPALPLLMASLCLAAGVATVACASVPAAAAETAAVQGNVSVIRKSSPGRRGRNVQAPPGMRDAGAARDAGIAGRKVNATALTLEAGGREQTTLRITLDGRAKADIATLAKPYRVIVDLPDVAFNLPDGRPPAAGLVKAQRYGLFGPDRSRIVLDTDGPVKVGSAMLRAARPARGKAVDATTAKLRPGLDVGDAGGETWQLIIPMLRTTAAEFGDGTGAGMSPPELYTAAVGGRGRPAAAPGPTATGLPLVMIDPGHGGIDPGAVGALNTYEKDIVLAVGRQLASALKANGRFKVAMTRDRDVFVSLDRRVAASRAAKAALFVSLHADSLPDEPWAHAVRGASIYTLSDRASDALARRLAEKENAADALAGLPSVAAESRTAVRDILLDLMSRETAHLSQSLSSHLVARMRNSVSLARRPQRAAAFRVLRQAEVPSVLIELGYLSNAGDETLMRTADWQNRVTRAIAAAIDTYFTSRNAIAR